MKKIISFVITVLLVASVFSLAAFAADTEATNSPATITNVGMEGYAVYKDWEENGYPDDIGLVIISSDGYDPSSGVTTLYQRFIIYVVEGTSEERKAELKEMMGTPYVEFRECTMSRNTQYAHVASLRARLGDLVYEIAPTADKFDLMITMYYPEENDEKIRDIVWDEFPEAAEYCEFRSGVDPNDLDGTMETGIETIGALFDGSDEKSNAVWFVAIAAILALTAGLFFVLRSKNVKSNAETLALNNGETTEASKPLSKREAEEKITQSVVEPSDKVFDEIMKSTDK